MLFPRIKILYYLRKNQFKMALTLKIFDNNRETARLCALDYIPTTFKGNSYLPTISLIKLAIHEKVENMIEEFIVECKANGMSEQSAYEELSVRAEDLLGEPIYANNLNALLHQITDSQQNFILSDRIEYNLQELERTPSKIEAELIDGVFKDEIKTYHSFIRTCQDESILSYLELLGQQNI
jgi:hypothetical protein